MYVFYKGFDNNDYRAFLNEMFEYSKRIGAAKERAKDCMNNDYTEVDFEIRLNNKGFQVYHDNKTFICQTGKQLVTYLKSVGVSDMQLIDMQELLLNECMKRGMRFPKDIID